MFAPRSALAFVTFAGLPLGAQQTRALAKPDVEFAEPFTNVNGVRELRDGRVVVSDVRDKTVQLIDFRSGRATKIGREGNGPREYALPLALIALPGDTSAIYDPLNRRFLLITPNGAPGEFFTIEAEAGATGGAGGLTVSLTAPRFTDARGRLYLAGSTFRQGPGGVQPADSVPLLRYDRSTKKRDTVGFYRPPKNNASVSGGGGRESIRIGGANPFAPRDEWAVTPDGRVAVIRSPELRIDWTYPRKVAGTPISYPRIRVTEKHKEQWRQAQQGATMMMVTNNNGRQTTSAGPAGRANIPEPTDWPDVLPPFLQNATVVAPNGNIWLNRTREGNDDIPKYDVIDASGNVIERVVLPKRTRVVGFGNGVVYAIRSDEDDLQYLQRFRLQ
jgi:hypothetical protein